MVDPKRCPLCSKENRCAAAEGKTDCWCMTVKIRPEALAAIPAEAKDKACLCQSCGAVIPPENQGSPGR